MASENACYYNYIMNAEILLIILSFILIFVGAAGVIIPFLPGLPIVWLGMLVFAKATNFAFVTWKLLLIFLGVILLTGVLDMLIPIIGAKKYHASQRGIYGAILGIIFGVFIFGPLGIIIGPLLGSFLGEMISGKDWKSALESSKGVIFGFLVSGALKLAVAAAVLGTLLIALLT